jgi:hypothetical protein
MIVFKVCASRDYLLCALQELSRRGVFDSWNLRETDRVNMILDIGKHAKRLGWLDLCTSVDGSSLVRFSEFANSKESEDFIKEAAQSLKNDCRKHGFPIHKPSTRIA